MARPKVKLVLVEITGNRRSRDAQRLGHKEFSVKKVTNSTKYSVGEVVAQGHIDAMLVQGFLTIDVVAK